MGKDKNNLSNFTSKTVIRLGEERTEITTKDMETAKEEMTEFQASIFRCLFGSVEQRIITITLLEKVFAEQYASTTPTVTDEEIEKMFPYQKIEGFVKGIPLSESGKDVYLKRFGAKRLRDKLTQHPQAEQPKEVCKHCEGSGHDDTVPYPKSCDYCKPKEANAEGEKELAQLFENEFDCYVDCEDVVMAMTKEKFIKVVSTIKG